MNRWSKLGLSFVAMGSVASVARAQMSNRSYDVCGGSLPGMSVLAFCAAVDVSVKVINNQPTVSMKIWNMSGAGAGWDPSFAWTSIWGIGLTHVIPQSSNVIAGSLHVTGPCVSNPNGCDFSSQWATANDLTVGGLGIDMLAYNINSGGIASSCDPHNPLLPRPRNLYTSCSPSGPNFVNVTFAVTDYFDVATTGDLFIEGARDRQLTDCVTGGQQPACIPTTATPEPGTLALVGSGLASFAGVGTFKRRRRRQTT
jgi:hypothetical protein